MFDLPLIDFAIAFNSLTKRGTVRIQFYATTSLPGHFELYVLRFHNRKSQLMYAIIHKLGLMVNGCFYVNELLFL